MQEATSEDASQHIAAANRLSNDAIHQQQRKGRLVPLKTKLEVRPNDDTGVISLIIWLLCWLSATDLTITVDVYVTAIPVKAANSILRVVQNAFPESQVSGLQHLRRFVKTEYLPEHLKAVLSVTPDLKTELLGNDPDSTAEASGDAVTPDDSPTRYFLVGAVHLIPRQELVSVLSNSPSFQASSSAPPIINTSVPLQAPTSDFQAVQWSTKYWPTIYKRCNPFGPHPSMLARAGAGLQPDIFMALARRAASEAVALGNGEAVGAVIVERQTSATFVACDARWHAAPRGERSQPGNVAAHAVLRAIGLVARKRRAQASALADPADAEPSTPSFTRNIFLDAPINALEKEYYDAAQLVPAGYLCLDLDMYMTHEPCVMCAMALLHSRFGRVVIGRRMPLTGGLTAESANPTSHRDEDDKEEPGLGYGLFWRQELNWRMLSWQWKDEDDDGEQSSVNEALDRVVHA